MEKDPLDRANPEDVARANYGAISDIVGTLFDQISLNSGTEAIETTLRPNNLNNMLDIVLENLKANNAIRSEVAIVPSDISLVVSSFIDLCRKLNLVVVETDTDIDDTEGLLTDLNKRLKQSDDKSTEEGEQ